MILCRKRNKRGKQLEEMKTPSLSNSQRTGASLGLSLSLSRAQGRGQRWCWIPPRPRKYGGTPAAPCRGDGEVGSRVGEEARRSCVLLAVDVDNNSISSSRDAACGSRVQVCSSGGLTTSRRARLPRPLHCATAARDLEARRYSSP